MENENYTENNCDGWEKFSVLKRFRKISNSTNFVMSTYPSVRPHRTRLPLEGFS